MIGIVIASVVTALYLALFAACVVLAASEDGPQRMTSRELSSLLFGLLVSALPITAWAIVALTG